MMNEQQQELHYPVNWTYRIVVDTNNKTVVEEVKKVLQSFGFEGILIEGDVSGTGKYRSYRSDVVFDSREMMEALSSSLSGIDGVKFVL